MEENFIGGRLTAGVVRIDDTVRRPATPASTFVANLLSHVRQHGFAACPRHYGQDDLGRDVVSFIPGTVVARWRRFSDADVEAVAGMLRDLHDASRPMVATATGYSRELASAYSGPDAVVCHHDPGPNNVVFDGGGPVAFIDFEFAAPGHRLEDVGYLAWSWCISSRPDREPAAEQGRQLRILADAYGLIAADRHRLLLAVAARLKRNLVFWRRRLEGPWTGPRAGPDEVVAWTRRELTFVTSHRDALCGPLLREN